MPITTLAAKEAEKLWADGVPIKRIAKQCGVTENMIIGFAGNNRDRFPARRKSPRLTEEQKARIKELHAKGFGTSDIARQVGCSSTSVYRLSNKEN